MVSGEICNAADGDGACDGHPTYLYRNDGSGQYTELGSTLGFTEATAGKGLAVFDYDRDGDLDVLIANTHDIPLLYRNDSSNGNDWLRIRFTGSDRAFEGIHARITLQASDGGAEQVREMGASTHFLSQRERVAHFGLAAFDGDRMHEVRVEWPRSGIVQVFTDLPVNQTHILTAPVEETTADPVEYEGEFEGEGEGEGETPGDLVIQPGWSAARIWMEALLYSIRRDQARPVAHARNLYHLSVAMWDAWAAYDTRAEQHTHLGRAVTGDTEAARAEAIAYASYSFLHHRFTGSPNEATVFAKHDELMAELGYDINVTVLDGDSPAALGNRIADRVITFFNLDGANEDNDCAPTNDYAPVHEPLVVNLALEFFIDQDGIVIGDYPGFLGPHWGWVIPFALGENTWLDPGMPPQWGCTPEEHQEFVDNNIDLAELLRLIQLYNLDEFRCDRASEDGYAPGAGDHESCLPHDSDYLEQGWSIDFAKLLRSIQLCNSSSYSVCNEGRRRLLPAGITYADARPSLHSQCGQLK